MEATLDFLVEELVAIGRLHDVEILVVDWGSEVPLHRVLEVSESVKKVWRHLLVPLELAKRICPENDFPRPAIMNAGIRRAEGEYVIQSVADVLWTRRALEKLFLIIGGGDARKVRKPQETLIVLGRREIPYEVASQELDTQSLRELVEQNEFPFYKSYPFFIVAADAIVLHRDLWFQSQGFDEVLRYWGWNDVDLNLRMQLCYRTYSFYDDVDLNVYHLEHIRDVSEIKDRPVNPQVFNPFQKNDSAWGCGDLLLEEYPPREPMDVQRVSFVPLSWMKRFLVVRFYKWIHQINCLLFFLRYRKITKEPFLYYWRIPSMSA